MAIINTSKLRFDSEDGNTYIFDKNLGATVVGQEVYTEEEQIVGKYMDGRPIYKVTKQVAITKEGNNQVLKIPDNLKEVVKYEGILKWKPGTSDENFILIPNINGALYGATMVYMDSGYIILYLKGSNFANSTAILSVYYTKTTDAPNSYKEKGTELTDEHWTGEYFQGKKVYEKMFVNIQTGSSTTSSRTTTLDVQDVETIIHMYTSGTKDANNNVQQDTTRHSAYFNIPNHTITLTPSHNNVANSYTNIVMRYTKTTD